MAFYALGPYVTDYWFIIVCIWLIERVFNACVELFIVFLPSKYRIENFVSKRKYINYKI